MRYNTAQFHSDVAMPVVLVVSETMVRTSQQVRTLRPFVRGWCLFGRVPSMRRWATMTLPN